VRAATYARLSDDGLSIPDQLASSRKYAEDRGWQVLGEFVDEHKSTFSGCRTRLRSVASTGSRVAG
jgi:hypothetical protein